MRKSNSERCRVVLGNIAKAQVESGVTDDLIAIRLGMSIRTYQRRKKNPELFTLSELLDIGSATKKEVKDLVGDLL